MVEIPEPDGVEVAIYKTFTDQGEDPPREYLGGSLIGHECDRYIWYTYRWAYREEHTGRMRMLFETGHR